MKHVHAMLFCTCHLNFYLNKSKIFMVDVYKFVKRQYNKLCFTVVQST